MGHRRWLVALGLLAAACPGQKPTPVSPSRPDAVAPQEQPLVWRMSKSGVGFRLRDADPEPPSRPKLAPATPLSSADTARLIARLPAFQKKADEKAFALREKSLPPPRPGETIPTPFPPAVAAGGPPAATATSAPALVRWAPEGSVDIAPNLSVTFSEPMLALTSHGDTLAMNPPVRLVPQPPGRFRWVGTQTLLFEPDGERFPKATDYAVEIPGGAKAASGRPLADHPGFAFSLPTAKVESFHPGRGEPTKLEPLLLATFNQRIDRAAILPLVALEPTASKGALIPLRLATDDEVEADETARQRKAREDRGRFIALKPSAPLPRATAFRAIFKRGMPSAEGPKRSTEDQVFVFETFGPLKSLGAVCAWGEGCPPLVGWEVRFSNRIDASKFDPSLVRIEPPLPDARVTVSHREIQIHGRSKGRTKYTIRVSAALADEFGQTLGKDIEETISVGPAKPVLFAEDHQLMVLDPAFTPALSVYSINHKSLRVRLYAVGPEHYFKYMKFRQDGDYRDKLTEPPGRLISNTPVRPEPKPDELVETRIPLGPALAGGDVGQVLAVVEPPVQVSSTSRYGSGRQWVRTWVQATKLGLQAFREPSELHGWVTKLSDGSPVAGAEFGVLGEGAALPQASGTLLTGADGMATLPLGVRGASVYARLGKDSVFFPANSDTIFRAVPRQSRLLWFVMDDRRLYKPGERVHVKGWLRIAGAGKKGDVIPLPSGKHSVKYRVTDPVGNEIAKAATAVDPDGGFTLAVDLSKNANLGTAVLAFELESPSGDFAASGPAAARDDRRHHHYFQIQEFRRPEFEITAETSEGPHYVGKHAIASVRATYYAGGSLPDSKVNWRVSASDTDFSPPNRGSYQFGKPPDRFFWFRSSDRTRAASETWEARTTAGGEHRLRIDFDALEPAYPRRVVFEVSVADVNRQVWTGRTNLLVHPANVTVGLRVENSMPTAGQNIQVDALVTDVEGKAVTGRPIALRSARIETTWRGDETDETEHDVTTCNTTSTSEAVRCTLATKEGGLYRLSAIVTDEHGRTSLTRLELWVLGGTMPSERGLRRGQVEVVPDKTSYKGGDEARLLLMAPFAPAEGVLTLDRDGVVELRRFRLEKRVGVVTVRLDRAWIPGVYATVRLVGAAPRENEAGDPDPSLPARPAFANGQATLALPPGERELAIALSPKPAELEPGGTTRIGIDVKDASGRAVANSTVALVVVDEAVLALAGYHRPAPLDVFYASRSRGVDAFETHDFVVLPKPDLSRLSREAELMGNTEGNGGRRKAGGSKKMARMAKPMASAAPAPGAKPRLVTISEVSLEAKDEEAKPITLRSAFGALAAFVPRLVTDANGRAEARVKLPDNLTRYRVTAVAAANQNQFGTGEADVTARLPLMVRPSAPRFLNFGDKAELPVVLQNQTASAMTVDVALRVDNLVLPDPNGRRLVVPAADRVEVRFPVAVKSAGSARIQVGASGRTEADPSGFTDAAEVELPVWTPATTEAFATYGVVDEGAVAQPVRMPTRVVKEFGGLDITTSSTALQGLSDAVLYLVRYPFECNEQIASRLLAIAALRDVLEAFSAEGLPKRELLEKTVALDIQRLADRQHWSGGWDYWRKDRQPDPFVSVHVAHALVRAKAKGYKVPEQVLSRALAYLSVIQHRFPALWPPEARRAVEAYALDVRRRAGVSDAARAKALVREAGGVEKMPIEALGWLLPLFSKDAASAGELRSVRRHLDNRVTETAGKAHFVTSYGEAGHVLLHSDRRADGVLLDAFLEDRPESDIVPKLVAGLLADRKRGRWYNTQENVFILLGLDHYFQKFEKATPSFVARAWLGGAFAGEHTYRGRTNDRQEVSIPLAAVAAMPEPGNVTLSKEGTGRLYFRIGMRYAPEDLRPPPSEHGFSVTRRYESAKDPADVKRDADGTWRVRAGALVRVRVTMVAPARRYHVALVDPLPAGFEALNSALATSASIPPDPEEDAPAGTPRKGRASRIPWWWSRAWYEHQNLRDERVEAFASLLWDGVYDYTYVARATTPGVFVVPPPKAEEMYDPETFGRGATDRVIVY